MRTGLSPEQLFLLSDAEVSSETWFITSSENFGIFSCKEAHINLNFITLSLRITEHTGMRVDQMFFTILQSGT